MKINRHGSAAWQGGIKDGKGSISTESGALKANPYGFASRFEGMSGTNPEEQELENLKVSCSDSGRGLGFWRFFHG